MSKTDARDRLHVNATSNEEVRKSKHFQSLFPIEDSETKAAQSKIVERTEDAPNKNAEQNKITSLNSEAMEQSIAEDTIVMVLHEVGHLIVLQHFGGFGHIELRPLQYNDPENFRVVAGCITMGGVPMDPIERAAVGAAGVIAVAMAYDPDSDAFSVSDMVDNDSETFSSSDVAMIGSHFWEGAELAFHILQQNWGEYERRVMSEKEYWLTKFSRENVPTNKNVRLGHLKRYYIRTT